MGGGPSGMGVAVGRGVEVGRGRVVGASGWNSPDSSFEVFPVGVGITMGPTSIIFSFWGS